MTQAAGLLALALIAIALLVHAHDAKCVVCRARWAIFAYYRCRRHRVKRPGRGAFNPDPPRGRPNVPAPAPPTTPPRRAR